VHGRFDLFDQMLNLIGNDLHARPVRSFRIVFLGDLIDRGPDSAKIISRAIKLSSLSKSLIFLKGNHEELFLYSLQGDLRAAEFFYKMGGRATLKSYGLDPAVGDEMDGAGLACWMQENIPIEHAAFIESFDDAVSFDRYILVHAGLRPNVPLNRQRLSDLRWIRQEFTDFSGVFPGVVVHGHSISADIDEAQCRIGIDTGAYRTGRLTAVAIERAERWYLTVQGEPEETPSEISMTVDPSAPDASGNPA
jgi:serine/threonine protein phosphatase 1